MDKVRKIARAIAAIPILPSTIVYYGVQYTLMKPFYKYNIPRLGALLTHTPIIIGAAITLGIFASSLPIWVIVLAAINIAVYFIDGFVGLVVLDAQL